MVNFVALPLHIIWVRDLNLDSGIDYSNSFLHSFLHSSGKCRGRISNKATAASFHILSNSVFINLDHSIIRWYIVSAIYSVRK
jgi:hypothetical protein